MMVPPEVMMRVFTDGLRAAPAAGGGSSQQSVKRGYGQ